MKNIQLKINTQQPIKKAAKFSPTVKDIVSHTWIDYFSTPKKYEKTFLNQIPKYKQVRCHTERLSLNTLNNKSYDNKTIIREHNIRSPKAQNLVFKKKKSILEAMQMKSQLQSSNKIKYIFSSIKKIMSDLEELITQFQEKFLHFTQQIINSFQQKIKQFNSFTNKRCQQKNINEVVKKEITSINKQKENINLKFEQMSTIKLDQIPKLDFSQFSQIIKIQNNQINKKKIKRQPQTQRCAFKKFQFDCPSRVSRKFSAFNQTLNRIKRLSFGGSIVKI